MTQNSFDCLCFLDNQNICILQISRPQDSGSGYLKHDEWLLLQKTDMSIKSMSLRSRDDSYEVQERYFNLGYLKYTPKEGIFIELANTGQHPLQTRNCEVIPAPYLSAVKNYMEHYSRQND